MIFLRKILSLAMVSFLALPLLGAEKPLASQQLLEALKDEVSGEIAYHYTVLISHYDRVQASEGFRAAAELIQQELEKIGYTDAIIEGWPSNGSRYYYTYQTPIGWRASFGELWITSPHKEKLCSYEEIPLTLVKHSNAANVEAELIDVGTGVGEAAYLNKDVKGKIVLATAYTGSVMREAVVKRGALGVITYFAPDERPGYPNMIRYTAVWPKWEEREKIGFGFNVSKNQGWLLKKMLAEGKTVKLKAKVEAEYYDSKIEVLSVSMPGTTEPEKEVMIIGHLCHPMPSTNDNASGSGGMLEMARALKNMIDKGLVEPPKRTIRFLWVPEFYGTIPYIQAHLERTRNTLSVINCDMIGEDLHLTGGTFNITCTPDSMPSYLNDVVVNFARAIERMNLKSMNGSNHPFAYRVLPYSGGSDHVIFNDGALKVPSVMFGHGDTFHHTSLDTPDKVDASELRRVCSIALGSSYYLANATNEQATAMARLIARNGVSRFSANYYDSLNDLYAVKSGDGLLAAQAQVLNVIEHAAQREKDAILSTQTFVSSPAVKKEIQTITANISAMQKTFTKEAHSTYTALCQKTGVKASAPGMTPDEKQMDKMIPVRAENFVCPLQTGYVIDKLGENAISNMRLRGNASYEALNFVDGKRSVYAIAKAVSAEFGPIPTKDFLDFFKVLEQAELITLK